MKSFERSVSLKCLVVALSIIVPTAISSVSSAQQPGDKKTLESAKTIGAPTTRAGQR